MELSAGDTAWVLASASMVLLMTPGLAFFYGGMVRSKSVLNMMMMSLDRKSTRLNSSHMSESRMPSSA